jgi:hypothetical protein
MSTLEKLNFNINYETENAELNFPSNVKMNTSANVQKSSDGQIAYLLHIDKFTKKIFRNIEIIKYNYQTFERTC